MRGASQPSAARLRLDSRERYAISPNMTITASTHTHMGPPPPGYHQEWVTHTVHVHGFGSLPSERYAYVYSPEFMLLGNQWLLRIYPGGQANAEEGMASFGLWNMSNKAIDIYFGFSVNDGNGKQVSYEQFPACSFAPVGVVDLLHTILLSSLVNGALIIEVRMKLATPTKSVPPPFIPENPVAKMIRGVFMDDKYSDIIFEVGGEEYEDNAMKVAKTASDTFPAHRLIVENCSSILADLCESHDDSTKLIQINDVTPDIFGLLLS